MHRSLNPLPLCRGRHPSAADNTCGSVFKSTPSMQRETCLISQCTRFTKFKSTPSMQRETHFPYEKHLPIQSLNPLPLCRGRPVINPKKESASMFKSTPSMQRETLLMDDDLENEESLNPLPLCRGRRKSQKGGYGNG